MSRMALLALLSTLLALSAVRAEDPYLFFTWNVTYGTIAPLGVAQQAILINGQFPGPNINSTTNNNIVLNVFNNLDEPFLLTWFVPCSRACLISIGSLDKQFTFFTICAGTESSRGRTRGRRACREPTAPSLRARTLPTTSK